jgi:Flp pilus assembly protein TadG
MTTTLPRVSRALILAFAIIGIGLLPFSALAATVTVKAKAAATIDAASLATAKAKPSLTGDATDVKTLRVVIENSAGKRLFKSKALKVRNDHWKVTSSKKLADGTYKVTVYDAKDKKQATLASGTLTVGVKGATSTSGTKSNGLIGVDALPLLSGGAASMGTSIPVAYLKVQNTSGSSVNLEGFTLKQNGSASGDSVIGFSTSDDKGGSRATIGGSEGAKQFKAGLAFVPLKATIETGTVRIFTIKSILSKTATADLGKQLFIDVTGVTSNGSVKASYPIRGVAWTLIR